VAGPGAEGWLAPGSFLTTLDTELRQTLLQAGTRRHFARHAVLFHQGDPSSHVALLLSGWVKISATSRGGYEALLAIRGPGDLVGELSAVDDRVRSATVLTLVAVKANVVPAEQFLSLLRQRPKLCFALLANLAGRLREADRRRLEFGALNVTERLARRLLALAGIHGRQERGGIVLDVPLSQRELAGAVSASREAVARILRILRERDVVTTRRQRIVIVQPHVLKSIADDSNPGT
jgi:CRP/FNR family transcriptional regulator, cyclic AMP receptor protein